MSLSQDPVFTHLKNSYVCGYRDITGKKYAGQSGMHMPGEGRIETTNGAGARNVQLFVLAPDWTVLHCLPGYWSSADLNRELSFAEKLAEVYYGEGSVADKEERFRQMQLGHVNEHPAEMRQRSQIQEFESFTEVQRDKLARGYLGADPSTVVQDGKDAGRVKTVDVIMHERMAERPFRAFEEFDVDRFVDLGGTFYDKHLSVSLEERKSSLRRVDAPASAEAGSGGGDRSDGEAGNAADTGTLMKVVDGAGSPPPAASLPPFEVIAVAGSPGNYTAVLSYHRRSFTVQAGDVVPDTGTPEFRVQEVSAGGVVARDLHDHHEVRSGVAR